MTEEEEVITRVVGGVGRVLLNRPKKLNCLSVGMLRKLRETLGAWDKEGSGVKAIVLRGAGRAFCSGGDVVSLYHGNPEFRAYYLREEYRLDMQISQLNIPYIAVMDGVTMGGGCGVSVNGRYRVATKRTLLSMPECGIGLVPDVGAGTFLPRLEGHLGIFMGLTGHRLEGRDCLSTGLATHYFSSKEGWDRLDKLEDRLEEELEKGAGGDVKKVLDSLFETKKSRLSISSQLEMIDKVFSLPTLGDVMEGLEALGWQAGDEGQVPRFARDCLAKMKTFSPTSLSLTFEHLKDKETKMTLAESLAAEQRMQTRCLASSDFREGVRVTLIEKDKGQRPHWKPKDLKLVTKEHLSPYLRPLPSTEALTEDDEKAWAEVLGMRMTEYQMAKVGRIPGQVY